MKLKPLNPHQMTNLKLTQFEKWLCNKDNAAILIDWLKSNAKQFDGEIGYHFGVISSNAYWIQGKLSEYKNSSDKLFKFLLEGDAEFLNNILLYMRKNKNIFNTKTISND
jgi:hypothetical protein